MDPKRQTPPPIAIIGLGMRLPAGVSTSDDFWEFLVNKKDGKCRVPVDRYDVEASYGPTASRQTVATEYGYFLDANLKAGDASFFPFKQKEFGNLDPQQRLLLEVCHECLENAGSTDLRGSNAGVFVGNFGEDWHNMSHSDPQSSPNMFRIHTASDFVIANRISGYFDFRGPSITTRTACSASMTSLHLACQALHNGDCSAALVAGSSLILNPSMTMDMTEQGVLSQTGSCKTFDASADGFARGEAINAILIKPLEMAVRDNDPIRAVIRATAVNSDGGTTAIGQPSQVCQESMIRHAYKIAGIQDISLTPFVECHGTGTQTGDPIEAKAVANVFAGRPTYIGSVKSNFGHAEGAAGLNSVIKAVLALEHETIPPNIHYSKPNPNIPFADGDMKVPIEPEPWPKDRPQRISINSFGIGGSNAHAIIESASSHGISQYHPRKVKMAEPIPSQTGLSSPSITEVDIEQIKQIGQPNGNGFKESLNEFPRLIPVSAASAKSLQKRIDNLNDYIKSRLGCLDSLAYTLTYRRQHLTYRSYCVTHNLDSPLQFSAAHKAEESPSIVFVFTGQGAQWPGMGRDMIQRCDSFHQDIIEMDRVLQSLQEPPEWLMEDVLCSDSFDINSAGLSQPLCTALQIALVNFLKRCQVLPSAVVGHSSGEIAAAYAVGVLSQAEAITCAYYRGVAIERVSRPGAMAAIGMGKRAIESYLTPGTQVACENSPDSVTISGDLGEVEKSIDIIKEASPDTFVRQLHVNVAYHSDHMQDCGKHYEDLLKGHLSPKETPVSFYSSVTGSRIDCPKSLDSGYWRRNLESPVLFSGAIEAVLHESATPLIFLEVGPHSVLQGPLRQIFRHHSDFKSLLYVPMQLRDHSSTNTALSGIGQVHTHGYKVDFSLINAKADTLPDLPRYPWDHSVEAWNESRVSKAWRLRSTPHHELLGSRCLEATEAEPAWRNLFHLHNVLWIADHKIGDQVLFPLAGYISMIGEAIRQLSGSEAYSIRNMIMKSGMLIPKSDPIEIMTTARQARITEMTNSSWYEFSVYSYNGTTWVQHCITQGKAIEKGSSPIRKKIAVSNARELPESSFYHGLRGYGLDLGPAFQNLQSILFSRDRELATTTMRPLSAEPTARYTAHPFLIDLCFQLATVAAIRGQTGRRALMLPSYIRKMEVYSGDLQSFIQSEVESQPNGSFTATVTALNQDGQILIDIDGGTWLPVGVDVATSNESNKLISAHMEWHPHIDFCKLRRYVHPRQDQYDMKVALEKATALIILEIVELRAGMKSPAPGSHMSKYVRWLSHEHKRITQGDWDSTVPEAKQFGVFDIESRKLLLKDILGRIDVAFGDYGVSFAQLARKLINPDFLEAIMSGEKCPRELLFKDPVLHGVLNPTGDIDASGFFYLAAHSKPNLRIIEISSGCVDLTRSIITALTASDGPMFAEYTFTTFCPDKLARAKERLEGKYGLEYKIFDMTKGLVGQGFQSNSYDVVIFSNVYSRTDITKENLAVFESLLDTQGWLCLWNSASSSAYTWRFRSLTLGLLPEWWDTNESHPVTIAPSNQTDELNETLRMSCFSPQLVISDDTSTSALTTLVISKLNTPKQRVMRTVTMLYDANKPVFALMLAAELEKEKVMVQWMKLTDYVSLKNEDIISTIDLEKPYLYEFDSETYETFLETMRKTKSRITWLTRPAQVRCSDPRYGLVPGMMRTIRQELGVHIFTVELEVLSAAAAVTTVPLLQMICNVDVLASTASIDYEFHISNEEVYVGRYHWFSMQAKTEALVKDNENCVKRLKVREYGLINSLHWVQQDRVIIPPRHVEIKVKWGGLNFRDVMVAMGVVPAAKDNFGIEASGIITRVGEGVENFAAGDNVVVMSPGTLASRIVVDAYQVVHLPPNMSLEEAGTIAVAYSTASMALIERGNLRRGQSVLIHTACGSVGLAAIVLSQAYGLEIYATAGSEAKVQYLEQRFSIPRTRIFNSRNDSFYDAIMRATKGRGVDLVLNSLSGELLHASWRCVAKRGKMIEIGKRDMFERGQLPLEMFRHNRTCIGLDMEDFQECVAEVDRSEKSKLLQGIEVVEVNGLPAIEPRHIFTPDKISDAFRFLRKGEHIGKVMVKFPDNHKEIPAVRDLNTNLFDHKATYLMVGGLGGLGKSLTMWFMEKGARNFVFLSRSAGISDADQSFIKDIESYGCRAIPVAGSVINASDVQRAMAAAETPISGVIQMSMLIRDLPLSENNFDNWRDGIASKVIGTWNLHNALAATELEFFILFSSLIGLWGQVGQANYAAANTFLDSFAQYRHGIGLPCSVIDLGPVEDIGWVSQNDKLLKYYNSLNLHMVQQKDIQEAIQLSIHLSRPATSSLPHNGYINVAHTAVGLASAGSASKSPLQHDIRMALCKKSDVIEEDGLDPATESMRCILRDVRHNPQILYQENTLRDISMALGRVIYNMLQLPPDDIDISKDFTSLGVDSLHGVELRDQLRRVMLLDISLIDIKTSGSIEGLGKLILEKLKVNYRLTE